MDNIHEPLRNQCLSSLALSNNILKHNSSDNFCVIKNDHAVVHPSQKTVSFYLTRLRCASNSLVHVLKCDICDHLTINLSHFKEHIRNEHPASVGFRTYSCCQCQSMSTEKCLMEEHMKIYHRPLDGATGSLIERFHEPNENDVLIAPPNSASSPVALANAPLSSSCTSPLNSSGPTMGLIGAIQNDTSPPTPLTNSPTEHAAVTSKTITHILTTSPVNDESSKLECPNLSTSKTIEVKSDESTMSATGVENACAVTPSSMSGQSVIGSRRRKATTPGRICLQTTGATNTKQEQVSNSLECTTSVKTDDVLTNVSKTQGSENMTNSMKRLASLDAGEVGGREPLPGPSSPKRPCTIDLVSSGLINTPIDGHTSSLMGKSQTPPNQPPLIISIGDSGELNQASIGPKTGITICPQSMTGLTTGPNSLIPISSESEQLLCGLSTALMTGTPMSQSLVNNNAGVTFSLPMMESQPSTTASGTGTWLLTNPQTNSNTMATMQPTLLVPVQSGLHTNDATIVRPLGSENPNMTNAASSSPGNGSNVLLSSDLLELIKSLMASGGNMISSISLPLGGVSNATGMQNIMHNLTTSSGKTATVGQTISTSVPCATTTAASLIQTSNGGVSSCNGATAAKNLINIITPQVSTASVHYNGNVTTAANSSNAAAALLNQFVMAALTGTQQQQQQLPTTTAFESSGEGVTTTINTVPMATRTSEASLSHEQALDMSVRSGSISIGSHIPLTDPINTTQSRQIDTNILTAIRKSEAPDNQTKPINNTMGAIKSDQSSMLSEVLSAALKGGLKQRLTSNLDGITTTSNMTPSLLQCLTAAVNPANSTIDAYTKSARTHDTEVGSAGNTIQSKAPTTHSILLPLSTTSLVDVTTNTPTSVLPSQQPQLVSLSQLQAIMAAMAANGGSSVSLAAPLMASLSTTAANSNPMGVGGSISTVLSATPQLHTQSLFSSTGNQVLLNQVPSSAITSSPTTIFSTGFTMAGTGGGDPVTATAMLLPSALTNAMAQCTGATTMTGTSLVTSSSSSSGLTMTIPTQAGLRSMAGSSTGNNEGLSLNNIISLPLVNTSAPNHAMLYPSTLSGNPTLINLIASSATATTTSTTMTNRSPNLSQQPTVALSSAAAARLLSSLTSLNAHNTLSGNAFTNSTTSTAGTLGSGNENTVFSGANLLDSSFLAAAAAAMASTSSPITLTGLRGLTANAGGGGIGTGTPRSGIGALNGPVISLLDPRTGLQLRVADVTSISTGQPITSTVELTNGGTLMNNTREANASPRTFGASTKSPGAEKRRKKLMESGGIETLVKTHDLTLGYHAMGNQSIEDTWPDSELDEANAVQANLQSIYSAGIKPDSMPIVTSPRMTGVGSPLLSNCNRRTPISAAAASRSPTSSGGGGGGGSRRSLLTDPLQSGGRPHRQNFTPTQNRILTEWYQVHQSKPYPSTDDTKELAIISGLSYSQVKKWFANKRARSSSSGLPKPTPPLAPDSSPDPSAAVAMVAAAVAAAAASATPTMDTMTLPYLTNTSLDAGQRFSLPHSQINLHMEVDLASGEEDFNAHSSEDMPPMDAVTSSMHSVEDDNGAEGAVVIEEDVEEEDEEIPLTVISDIKSDHTADSPCDATLLTTTSGPLDSTGSPPTVTVHINSHPISPPVNGYPLEMDISDVEDVDQLHSLVKSNNKQSTIKKDEEDHEAPSSDALNVPSENSKGGLCSHEAVVAL